MVIIPPVRNPWIDLSKSIGQGMIDVAQAQNMARAQALAERRQAVQEQMQNAQMMNLLATLQEKQREWQLGQQPSPLGFISKVTKTTPTLPQGVTGMEGYVPPPEMKTTTETGHIPINWEQIKQMGPSITELIKEGLIGTQGGAAKPPVKTYGALDQAMMAKYGVPYIQASPEQKQEIDTLVYGKGTGAVADAVKQVTGGKKQWYNQLDDNERKAVDQLVQKQSFNVQFGGQMGQQQALGNLPGSFHNWTPEQKMASFENYIVNKQMPMFAWRDSASRNAWNQEYNDYLVKKNVSAESIYEKRAYQGATEQALDQNMKYYGATVRFTKNIDDLADRAKQLRQAYGVNYGKLVNQGINNLRQGITGSGDLAVIQQFLTSLSLEVAKVESGEMGVSAATESQQKLWGKIHDWNLNVDDVDKVLDASKELGAIRVRNLKSVTNELRKSLGQKEVAPQQETTMPSTPTGGLPPGVKNVRIIK